MNQLLILRQIYRRINTKDEQAVSAACVEMTEILENRQVPPYLIKDTPDEQGHYEVFDENGEIMPITVFYDEEIKNWRAVNNQ